MPIKKDKKFDELFEAILKLESIDECYALFDVLCTMSEINDMKDRFEVAKLLVEGKTYAQIENETSMSSATISRVNRCVQYGPGGYRIVLSRLNPKRA